MWDGVNRRKFPRASYFCKITLYSREHPEVFSCYTQNLGRGGLCVVLNTSLRLFSLVGLELFLEDSHPPLSCAGRVVWVVGKKEWNKPIPDSFDTGIEFVDLKEEGQKRIEKIIQTITSGEK